MIFTESAILLRRRLGILVAIPFGLATAVAIVIACGPDFPSQFLDDREDVLLQLPSISMSDGLAMLIKRAEGSPFKAVESRWDDETPPATTDAIETDGLDSTAAQKVKEMRALEDGDAAYAAGAGVPEDVRQYTAGAVSFHHDQLDSARSRFESILTMPQVERGHREVWAHFMLGRLAAGREDVEGATAHFQHTRALVQGGADDRLGLAVASFGEEARVYAKPGTITKAVDLYARQASFGSTSALLSLLTMAARIASDEPLLEEGLRDPFTRRLLLLYAQAGDDQEFIEDPAPASSPGDSESLPLRILKFLERNGLSDADGMGWLAASAYQNGRFDVAERLAAKDKSATAAWVRAKLALRKGDTNRALEAYKEAFAANPDAGTLQAEMALLHMGRDEYAQALALFYQAAAPGFDGGRSMTYFWMDAAYLAERVLTVDELKDYVDRNVPAPSPNDMEAALEQGNDLPQASIRSLLARRLMREHRRQEAFKYFDDEHVRSVAEEYDAHLARAASWWRSNVGRAESWFSAATMARFDGLELLGYELEPDYAIADGLYEFGSGNYDDQVDELEPARTKEDKPPLGAATSVEAARVKASAPKPNLRFHYRMTAAAHAVQAANRLPPSSEAFASVLCLASNWAPSMADDLYGRYIGEGPYVAWARDFGRRCPQPDFDAAARRAWGARADRVAAVTRAHPILIGLAVILLTPTSIVGVRTVRRIRAPRTIAPPAAETVDQASGEETL